MPTFSFDFYDVDPLGVFSTSIGGTATYTGPATADGAATITDNGAGASSLSLEGNTTGETATGTFTVDGNTSTNVTTYAEESWTLRDTVTGETFEVVTLRVSSGDAVGYYTLSEIPLVAGRSYQTLDYDTTPDAEAGDPVFTYDDYSFPDGIVEGTSGDDVIDADYTGDPEGDVVDGNDAPSTAPPTPLEFNWTDYADETDLVGGGTQDTGGIDVAFTVSAPAGSDISAENSQTQYTGGGPYNPNSSLRMFNDGAAEDTIVTFDFSADPASGFEDGVQNVSFRINDIDGVINGANNFQDVITIVAYDVDGNEIPVTITPGSDVTVAGQTITGALNNTSEANEDGSALIEIPGPVAQIVITYDNLGDTQQAIYLTDLHFEAIPIGSNDDIIQAGAGNDIVDAGYGDDQVFGEEGDDTLSGGQGADLLDGGTGNDTLNVGGGDTATGGDGDDTFIIDPTLANGDPITITGGEGDETAGDTLDFNGQLQKGSIVYTNTDDDAGGLSGTATLLDGTTVTFSEIETIICFASGTMIDTPHGPRAIETLRPGDFVLTADHGPEPILWHGRRKVEATGDLAPIRIARGTFGNSADLTVSPQHRLLIRDYRSQLYFGEDEVLVAAKAFAGSPGVGIAEGGSVTYHHLLFGSHQIIFANGAATESFHPGDHSLGGLGEEAREELFALFPELRTAASSHSAPARPIIRPARARLLAA